MFQEASKYRLLLIEWYKNKPKTTTTTEIKKSTITTTNEPHCEKGERTGLVVRASASGSGDPGSILGRVGVLFP